MKRRIVALAAGFAALLPFVLLPTTAAWTDDAHFTAEASAGTWPTGPTEGCRIMTASGVDTGKPCTINYAGSHATDFGDGALPGSRTANVYVKFQFGAPGAGEYVVATVDVRKVPGLPAGWSTWETPLRGFSLGNLTAEPGALCSDLPLVVGRVPSWGGGGQNIHFVYYEDRTGKSELGCS